MPRDGAGHLRLFFAIPLAEELRDRGCELQRELAATGAKVKWVERDNQHMTLKFVGETPHDRLPALCEVGRTVAAAVPGFDLSVRGVGCFRSGGLPRTIWTGVAQAPLALSELAGALDTALAQAGLAEPEKRRFSAHFTLGRVKSRHHGEQLLAAIEGLCDAEVGPMRVRSFALMSSELTPGGPVYTEQAAFELQGGA